MFIGFMAASTIRNYMKGKDFYFTTSQHQYLEKNKKVFPMPSRELVISGDGNTIITILPGRKLTVLSSPRMWDCVFTKLEAGKSLIRFQKLNNYGYNEPVTIFIPEIPALSLNNLSEVVVKRLEQKDLRIQCIRINSFVSDSCRIIAINLDFPGKKDQQDIYINKSNQFNCFIASVQGFGKIRLESVGLIKNQISLSDSIHIEATYDLMKKLHH
jgi:hypothetical protein